MPQNNTEQSWAVDFNKKKQSLKKTKDTPLHLQKINVKIKIKETKNKLISSADAKDIPETEKYLNELIKLKAKFYALELGEINEQYEFVSDVIIKAKTQKFLDESIRIASSVDALLKQ